jgi:glycerol-3-phosphate dehydrogenase
MAANLICARLGVNVPCPTATTPLPGASVNDWVVAGVAPGLWRKQNIPGDALLCECEMVPVSGFARIVEQIRAEGETVDLDSIRLRSRMGKGSCQGAFCGLRITEYLYEKGIFEKEKGIASLRKFLESRWKGLRPVLWGRQMVQEQLQEAVHCGLFGLEKNS